MGAEPTTHHTDEENRSGISKTISCCPITPLNLIRIAIFFPLILLLLHSPELQPIIDNFWNWLRHLAIFRSVYFETWYVTIVYGIWLMIPAYLDENPSFDKFKLDRNSRFEKWSWGRIIGDAIIYMIPLALLDTFMVKAYCGVPEILLMNERTQWIQTIRVLPEAAPSVREIFLHLLISFLIYDALFFAIHLFLHKQPFCYKHIHSLHHRHEEGLQGRVTNRLTVTERVVLVLSANFSLKILGAHPLTRTIYVPIFVWLLLENHINYDLPYSYEKIIPLGLMGGSRHHWEHHSKGMQNFEPFFTHLDKLYQSYGKKYF